VTFIRNGLTFGLVTSAWLGATGIAHAQDSSSDRTLAAQTRLTATLVTHLQVTDRDNAIVSPAGIAAALALLDIGTSDGFRQTARGVLGFDNSHPAASDFENLRDQVSDVDRLADSATPTLSFANAAVFDPRLEADPQIIARMRDTRADVSVASLSDHATVNSINQWVANKTKGLIPEIVDDSISSTRLIVLNALYFKDDWATPFNKASTQQAAFHDSTGGAADVPMMSGTVTMPFRSDGRFAAIDLHYKSGRFALTLVTTRDSPASFAEFAGVANWLSGSDFEPTRVNLQLPRFTLRQSMDVLPALDAAGLADARHDPAAFAPISRNPLDISAILQKVYLRINEQGTEAAAVTSVMVRGATVRIDKTDSASFDKPFIFALRDEVSGLILLSGYIGKVPAEPTQ
jgi:serpin B